MKKKKEDIILQYKKLCTLLRGITLKHFYSFLLLKLSLLL